MDVTLRINKIDGMDRILYFELVENNTIHKFTTSIHYKIHTVHDLLFGMSKILIRSNGFLFTNLMGVGVLRNIQLTEKTGNIIIPILDGSYSNKTDYLVDTTQHKNGTMDISYTIEYFKTGEEHEMQKNNFVHKLFDLFLARHKSSLIKNLNNLIEEASKGSSKCKFNILFGIYLIDKYMSKLNHLNTANVKMETIQDFQICIVEKTLFPTPITNPDDLEGALLRYKYNYKRQTVKEYLKTLNLRNKYKIIKVECENLMKDDSPQQTVKLNNFSFNTFLKYVFLKKEVDVQSEDDLDDELSKSMQVVNDEALPGTIKDLSFNTKKWILKLLEKEIFYHDVHRYLKPGSKDPTLINDLMSNEGYTCAHKILIGELLNIFYFAIGPYGNTWPTTFLERRTKIDPEKVPDGNRRAILETLNISNDMLLSVSMGNSRYPDHIIFYDEINKRLVLSFKGTSTSDETLHDLDCEYTTFYEGLTHKGIKRLGMSFAENRAEEIIFLLGVFNTKDLLITGHSLGGSLATIVSIIFDREKILDGIRITTISFSSAPVVSYNLVKNSYKNMFTVNYGNDLIPRLSYGSVVEMKYVCCSLGSQKRFIESEEDGIKKLEDIRDYLNQTQFFPKLYHPGRVYQLKRIRAVKGKKLISLLMFKDVGLDFYENLLIIKHAPKHHMINHIASVLKDCLTDYDKLTPDCLPEDTHIT